MEAVASSWVVVEVSGTMLWIVEKLWCVVALLEWDGLERNRRRMLEKESERLWPEVEEEVEKRPGEGLVKEEHRLVLSKVNKCGGDW